MRIYEKNEECKLYKSVDYFNSIKNINNKRNANNGIIKLELLRVIGGYWWLLWL